MGPLKIILFLNVFIYSDCESTYKPAQYRPAVIDSLQSLSNSDLKNPLLELVVNSGFIENLGNQDKNI